MGLDTAIFQSAATSSSSSTGTGTGTALLFDEAVLDIIVKDTDEEDNLVAFNSSSMDDGVETTYGDAFPMEEHHQRSGFEVQTVEMARLEI